MITPIELAQGSEAWIAARVGKWGASELGALMAKGEGKTRAALIRQKICERLSGRPQGWTGNKATESGHEQEPLARRAYEELSGAFVVPVGLVQHPTLINTHASPDGLVDEDGGLELKSHVKFTTHFEAIEQARAGGMNSGHRYQCQWGMACTGRAWWAYGHYCREAPDYLRLYMFPRVLRDEAMIGALTEEVQRAETEVAAKVEAYTVQFLRKAA